jgi:hypothetical protein
MGEVTVKIIVYCVAATDMWIGWQKPSDLFRASVHDHHSEWHDPDNWNSMWASAKRLASRIAWEGDIREGPYVTVLPEVPGDQSLPPVVIAWKQDHRGTTFIASPFELPWINANCLDRIEE